MAPWLGQEGKLPWALPTPAPLSSPRFATLPARPAPRAHPRAGASALHGDMVHPQHGCTALPTSQGLAPSQHHRLPPANRPCSHLALRLVLPSSRTLNTPQPPPGRLPLPHFALASPLGLCIQLGSGPLPLASPGWGVTLPSPMGAGNLHFRGPGLRHSRALPGWSSGRAGLPTLHSDSAAPRGQGRHTPF